MRRSLLADETGFIVSSELVLIATILVIGLIVGMSEVQHAVVGELNDVADAIGSANQSYSYSGFTKRDRGMGWGGGWGWGGVHAYTAGSLFVDLQDACDLNQCMLACNPPVIEAPKFGAGGYVGIPPVPMVAVPGVPAVGVVPGVPGVAVPVAPIPGVAVPVFPVPDAAVPVVPVVPVPVVPGPPCTDCPAPAADSAVTPPTPVPDSPQTTPDTST
jgi:hypothetical protein